MNTRRINDSSKNRVGPVFDALLATSTDWPRRLLDLAAEENAEKVWSPQDLRLVNCFWQSSNPPRKEKSLDPPIALLEWLVWNAKLPTRGMPRAQKATVTARQKLCQHDPETIVAALDGLASGRLGRRWYVLEGPSYPDAFIETNDAVIVVEGKFTEAGATTATTWMPKRHQMLRHLDAAWEIKGERSVYGLFAVEADVSVSPTAVPAKWVTAFRDATTNEALAESLPHRLEPGVREAIAKSLVGITTWQAIQHEFHLSQSVLRPRQ